MDGANSPRVVPINERNPDKASEQIAQWLVQHYPGLKVIQLATVKQKNRFYQRATIQTANGQRKVILFDVTLSNQNNMNTTIRAFPGGTMVRLWPGTGSRPTRNEILI
jgi:hypothetical protein